MSNKDVLMLTEKEIDDYVVPYNRALQKEHPLLWKLNYIGLKGLYLLLRRVVPRRKENRK